MPTTVDLEALEQQYEDEYGAATDRRQLIPEGNNDLIFNFRSEKMSAWRGVRTSEMSMDHEGRSLLRWLLKIDIEDSAKKIIEAQLEDAQLLI